MDPATLASVTAPDQLTFGMKWDLAVNARDRMTMYVSDTDRWYREMETWLLYARWSTNSEPRAAGY